MSFLSWEYGNTISAGKDVLEPFSWWGMLKVQEGQIVILSLSLSSSLSVCLSLTLSLSLCRSQYFAKQICI